MIQNRENYKVIAILMAAVGAGLPLWSRSVTQVDFSDPSFLGLWLAAGILTAFITLFFVNLKMSDMVAAFTAGYVIAVIVMFVGGILINNYIHNQLTLALPVSMIAGVISGFTGSTVWSWIKRKKSRKKQ